MARKKWTAQTEITESLLKFREKRKWQLGFRRYVLEKKPNEAYAPYFGLDIDTIRQWFELQFTDGLTWDNFGKAWQFDHIVPANYFDFSIDEDLKLCWSFINLRVESIEANENGVNSVDVLAARPYFEDLYNKTGFSICQKMIEKIKRIESTSIQYNPAIENFILTNKIHLENITTLDHYEFNRLNQGAKIEDILLEREILRKFS